MSLPYQNNDKQLLTDLCACTDFITCFLGGKKRRQVICIVLISPLWSNSAGVAHFCNTMLPAKTFYLEAFSCCLSLGFFGWFDFFFSHEGSDLFHTSSEDTWTLWGGLLCYWRRDIYFFLHWTGGLHGGGKKEIKSNKGTAQVLCGWVCTCRTLRWLVRQPRGDVSCGSE